MRVVHLSTLHRALDGRIFHKECRTLAAHGYDVHFLVPAPPAAGLDGVHFHALDKPGLRFRPARIVTRWASTYRQAAALRGDVYHFHDPELIPVGLALKRTGARVIYDVHEDAPVEALSLNKDRPWHGRCKSWGFAVLERAACRGLDAFVCATPAIARKFPGRRTVTVQNFPLADEFAPGLAAPRPYRERPPQLIYAGGLNEIRGVREMVRALEHLPTNCGVRLLLAGQFDAPGLRAEVARLPGWERVEFAGWQSRHAVRAALAEARVGLVLLHPEPIFLTSQPTKLFEYMAAGLPVLASDFPAWRPIVRGLGCGLLVDPLDPAAIARAADYLLTHPAEAEAMGQRGRQAVRQRFHWEREAGKLLDLYRQLGPAWRQAASLSACHHGEAA